MGLQKIVVLCVVGAIVVAGGFFLFTSNSSKDSSEISENTERGKETDDTSAVADTNKSAFGSFVDILALGDNYQCTFSYSEEGITSEGTVYVAGDGRVRMDMISREGDEKMEFHTINTGTKNYVWSGPEFAMVTDISDVDDRFEVPETPGVPAERVQTDVYSRDDVEYDCDSWRVDESQFTPPEDIEFFDINNIQSIEDLQNIDFSQFGQPGP